MAATAKPGLIVCFGEMLIDLFPTTPGVRLAEAPRFVKAPGGTATNVATAVADLGGNAAVMGKVGDDVFGNTLLKVLKADGVSTAGVIVDKGARTALAFQMPTPGPDGECDLIFYGNPTADMLLRPEELNLDLIRSAKVFHYGSITLMAEPYRSAHLKALEAAKEGGALLCFDPNLRLESEWPSAEDPTGEILSIWEKADVIIVSGNELCCLTPYSVLDDGAAQSLFHPELKLLLVTIGDIGCKYYTKKFHGAVDGYEVRMSVDSPNGAGDTFVGAILYKIADDRSVFEDEARLREVVKFACASTNHRKVNSPDYD